MDICKSFDLADCLDARSHLEEISTSADGTTSTDCGTVYLLVHTLIPAGLEQSPRPDLLGEKRVSTGEGVVVGQGEHVGKCTFSIKCTVTDWVSSKET